MSTGYLILFYKNILIESYIRNFLMTKYISLSNAIGANKLISKIKYYHRNYFCFINKGKNIVRCIIKLNKITNNQIDLKIKSQQELTLTELKKSEIFRSENIIIENFFNLENNSDFIYSNNKINLLVKESNNIYEINCVLLEDSIDMGTFEKIKKCMIDKENTHTNEIHNNLRHNPLISNILNYQSLRNKNFEEFLDKKIENGIGIGDISNIEKNENNDKCFFDMKHEKYFLFDDLLVNKNDNRKLFDGNKLSSYQDLTNEYQSIFEISDIVFKKPFSELEEMDFDNIKNIENKDLKIESKENNKDNNKDIKDSKNIGVKNNEISSKINQDLDNSYKKETTKDIYRTYENPKIKMNVPSRSYSNINNFNNDNYSPIKDEQRFNDGYKRYDKFNRYERFNKYNSYDSYNNNYYYNNNNFKRNSGNNSFSYDNTNDNNTTNDYNNNNDTYSNNNSFNRTEYNNNNNKYHYQNNDKYNYRTNNKFRESNQYKNNFYNNLDNNSTKYIYRRNERYNNMSKDYYRNNNYNHSYHSSNNNSFNSERQSNFSRSRDKSPIQSPNQYSRYDSPREKPYDNKYNERNDYRKNNNNNYYGDNNNINYYYNINNYYRQDRINRWNDNNNYYQKEKNLQRNKNDYYNSNNNNNINNNNNNQRQFYYRDRRREEPNEDY